MKIKTFSILLLAMLAAACSNSDWEYADYDIQACYFPFQTPARTLILGKYDQGINDNDNNHAFDISATITGIYENTEERKIHFVIDNTLLNNVSNVKVLPPKYYSLETVSPLIIPAGSTKGSIRVQLSDDFFDDPLAFGPENTTNYVVPVRITNVENLDSVLTGVPVVENADRLDPEQWEVLPKDYTLFGIKFMNKYHGDYLMRGLDSHTDAESNVINDSYHADYVERDLIVSLLTSGRNKVILEKAIRRGDEDSPGNLKMELAFDENDDCVVSSAEDDLNTISGTGRMVEDGDTWGGKNRDVIYLEYTYNDAVNSELHTVNDTLVIRDRKAVFEEFEVELIKED